MKHNIPCKSTFRLLLPVSVLPSILQNACIFSRVDLESNLNQKYSVESGSTEENNHMYLLCKDGYLILWKDAPIFAQFQNNLTTPPPKKPQPIYFYCNYCYIQKVNNA